eukprot:3054358-Rhodomonas_salina.1
MPDVFGVRCNQTLRACCKRSFTTNVQAGMSSRYAHLCKKYLVPAYAGKGVFNFYATTVTKGIFMAIFITPIYDTTGIMLPEQVLSRGYATTHAGTNSSVCCATSLLRSGSYARDSLPLLLVIRW